jgi:hypothetical protein
MDASSQNASDTNAPEAHIENNITAAESSTLETAMAETQIDGENTKSPSHQSTADSEARMASDAVPLDPEGDVILVMTASGAMEATEDGASSFLVSSKVLGLASPVFAKMFGPNFIEGQQVRRGERPSIELEDDPKAMQTLLRILHHKLADVPLYMAPKPLMDLAILADKYNCLETFRPWSMAWCKCEGITSANPDDFGYVLLAAHLLKSPMFSAVVVEVAKHLMPCQIRSWQFHETLSMLPKPVESKCM